MENNWLLNLLSYLKKIFFIKEPPSLTQNIVIKNSTVILSKEIKQD